MPRRRLLNCQNETVAKRSRIQNRRDETIMEQRIVEDYCGGLTHTCASCKAKHFKAEVSDVNSGSFSRCCHKGKVNLDPFSDYPPLLKQLLMGEHEYSKNYLENIRSFNSSLSFASLGAKITPPPGNGPYCFRIHGQIYHRTGTLHPVEGEKRQYSQLYIIDTHEASMTRMSSPENIGCNPDLMFLLSNLITKINPYASAYKMLYDVEQEAIASGHNPASIQMVFKQSKGDDPRRYNNPRVNEVAIIFENADGSPPFERDLLIHLKPEGNNQNSACTKRISILNRNLEPMTYPLLFPTGEEGWNPLLMQHKGDRRVTQCQYYAYRLSIRDEFNPILSSGKLTQQYIVDAYVKTEANRINFIVMNQSQLRVGLYKGLMDHINSRAENEGLRPGTLVILPSTFIGSPRNMQQNYKDAMAIVQKFGKPDLFITMTCNPRWKEIVENLKKWERVEHRPDLVSRVFKIKLKSLMADLCKNNIFGKVISFIYVVEFQKRGLPHAHILVILSEESKLRTKEIIDSIVCSEIPDKNHNNNLYEIVTTNMVHGPCGSNFHSPCMIDDKCTKGYPKSFQPETITNEDGYPKYRRREGVTAIVRGNILDNRWIVPYNPYLIQKYNCHINVEVCASFKSVKYLFKYVYKGHDCASISITESNTLNHDETQQYLDSRYVSAPEACWRLFEFRLHDQSHHIIRLPVHLPQEQSVYFQSNDLENALRRAQQNETMLTAWFKLNLLHENARHLLYTEIPYEYVFSGSVWQPRKRGRDTIISRMYTVNPLDSERFYLRLILLHKPGALSFEHLRSINGVEYLNFREAATALGLLESNDVWKNTLQDAAAVSRPKELRQLFAFILILSEVTDPLSLWEMFLQDFTSDFCHQLGHTGNCIVCEDYALHDLGDTLSNHGKQCADFGLRNPDAVEQLQVNNEADLTLLRAKGNEMLQNLNTEQVIAFNKIMNACNSSALEPKCFFLDGPGGSGKTYLYSTLLCVLRGEKVSALASASTGIAANLLQGGRTAHSQYKIPVPVNETSVSRMNLNSTDANEIRTSKLLIVDEATMVSNNALNVIDRLLREIMDNNIPFGGKVILLGGDFRQCLPVIPHGMQAAVIQSSIKYSRCWHYFNTLTLNNNIRSRDSSYSSWLLKLGNGELLNDVGFDNDVIEVPFDLVSQDIVHDIFGNSFDSKQAELFSNRAILCPKNDEVDKLNEFILQRLDGESYTYLSIDKIECDDKDEESNFPIEFVHSITPSGMPPHKLNLKIGCIIILLRNLNARRGLCNGTRLIITTLFTNVIEAKVLTGSAKGNFVLIPRISIAPSNTDLPFKLNRRQFPVKLAFAMTINKSQGQTLDKVGIYLQDPVFGHGQLYVAFSRVRCASDVKIQIINKTSQGSLLHDHRIFTKNIVYREVF